MFGRHFRKSVAVLWATAVLLGVMLPVWALPPTGDGSSTMLPLILGLLGLSAILIVVYILLSVHKKKGR